MQSKTSIWISKQKCGLKKRKMKMHICTSGRQQSELICHTSLRNGKQCEYKTGKETSVTNKRKSLDQESRPVVFHLGPNLPFESFRLSPHELLFYSGEDGDRNNFMNLRCIVHFGSPDTRDWHTGVSAAEFRDGKCRSTSLQRAEGAGLAQSGEGIGSQALHCCACWVDARLWAEAEGGEVQNFPVEFPPEGSQEQMTQRLCDSILGVGSQPQQGLLKAFSNLA